jgi:hypothetical protein
MRRILYLAIPLFALGGCAAEWVDPDFQEDEYDLTVAGEPEEGPDEQPVTLDPVRDPVLSNADGDPTGPTPYPWLAKESGPGGPSPYPWESESESSSGTGNGSSDTETKQGADPSAASGGESPKPKGG